MSLIECPECGREVSDAARACPHCGFPFEVTEALEREVSEHGNRCKRKGRKELRSPGVGRESPQAVEPTKLMSVSEAARILGVSYKTTLQWAKQGKLVARQYAGNRGAWRVLGKDLLDFIAKAVERGGRKAKEDEARRKQVLDEARKKIFGGTA